MDYSRFLEVLVLIASTSITNSAAISEKSMRNRSHLEFSTKKLVIQVNEVQRLLIYSSDEISIPATISFRVTVDNQTLADDDSVLLLSRSNITIEAYSNASHAVDLTGIKSHQNALLLASCVGNESCPFENLDTAFVRVDIVQSHILVIVTTVIGWIYFAAWSISFYPQMLINWRRKSVVGLDFNFVALNLTGFTCYSIFNCALFWNPEIQREYFEANPTGVIPVQPNDIFFGLHAAMATMIVIAQCCVYEKANQRISWICYGLHAIFGVFAAVSVCLAIAAVITWLRLIQFISYIKLTITLLKYIPQAVYNYRRKSTVGWSIANILLDFTGGSLSLLQMVLDSYNYNDWQAILEDFTKLGLGAISLSFDTLFIVQHYCLYTDREKGHLLSSL